jgi:hypothetical protein
LSFFAIIAYMRLSKALAHLAVVTGVLNAAIVCYCAVWATEMGVSAYATLPHAFLLPLAIVGTYAISTSWAFFLLYLYNGMSLIWSKLFIGQFERPPAWVWAAVSVHMLIALLSALCIMKATATHEAAEKVGTHLGE